MSMTTFRPVNTTKLGPDTCASNAESTMPTTPRPHTAPDASSQPATRIDDATTPTKTTFGSGLATQKPLPASPFPAAVSLPEASESDRREMQRAGSHYSAASKGSEDVDMDGSDDGEDGSDEESINPDGTRSTKKKKSQKFYCTDFPPCTLSFTRSEHLARHIRKHTGERPFQCHCSRRFSRLDNLRQHAQTVHVNEDIPPESLAATGTRFQRQVRTDRVRPPGNRSRASTGGSQGPQVRGHHRNSLSASSINSIGSTYSQRDDYRRRPPPLVMAQDPRARHSLEAYGSRPESPSGQYYRPQSPGGYTTPPSATYSTGQNSPRWGSALQSPISSHSRTASLYADHRTPGRRLSVPSGGANPFTSPYSVPYGPPMLSPLNSATQSNFPAGGLSSPTSSASGSTFSRRESISSVSDDAWRRRTWHPETHSNFTSKLANVTTVSPYGPTPVLQQYAAQPPRLPGIESFDPIRPGTPPRRAASPMMVDTPSRHYQTMHPEPQIIDQRSHHYDRSLTHNLNRLEIAQQPIRENASQWAQETDRAVMQIEPPRQQVRFEQPSQYATYPPHPRAGETISAPPITPRTQKRQAWYQGPITAPREIYQRTSPEGSSGSEGVPTTPSSNSVTDSYPSIVHANGFVESAKPMQHFGQQGIPTVIYQGPPPSDPHPKQGEMNRLEALVAVATRDENVASAY